jgi:phage shock protein A
MANERRLRSQAESEREAAGRWASSAKAALARGDEDGAREALRRSEQAQRHADELARHLAEQEEDTARIRKTVGRLKTRVVRSKARLQLLQSRIRQTEARRACSTVLRGVDSADLYGEFERLGEKVELAAAGEEAYLEIDDELSGDALRARLEEAEVDDAVEERLVAMRSELGISTAIDTSFPDEPNETSA